MIDKTNIIETVLQKMKGLAVGHHLDLRTYKRDRSVVIVKGKDDSYLVVEDGFYKEKYEVKHGKLKRLLKSLLKKEFPRSNKIRLYVMGAYDPEDHSQRNRRTI